MYNAYETISDDEDTSQPQYSGRIPKLPASASQKKRPAPPWDEEESDAESEHIEWEDPPRKQQSAPRTPQTRTRNSNYETPKSSRRVSGHSTAATAVQHTPGPHVKRAVWMPRSEFKDGRLPVLFPGRPFADVPERDEEDSEIEDEEVVYRSPTKPGKRARVNYSLEDDKILFNMLYQHVGLAEMEKHSGVVLYRHVAKLFPRHTAQSWRERWTKRLCHYWAPVVDEMLRDREIPQDDDEYLALAKRMGKRWLQHLLKKVPNATTSTGWADPYPTPKPVPPRLYGRKIVKHGGSWSAEKLSLIEARTPIGAKRRATFDLPDRRRQDSTARQLFSSSNRDTSWFPRTPQRQYVDDVLAGNYNEGPSSPPEIFSTAPEVYFEY